ncbi:MAG TPA: ABC-three component system protein [Rhizomicrobium sp.]|jgi:hypothetical protein|nr:ABC-three component system protein [Rhizomicrobium sp.]
MSNTVDQSGAHAGEDIVAGNKEVHYHLSGEIKSDGVVAQLLQKLRAEMDGNDKIKHTVENLQFFYNHIAGDGVVGLEAKLIAAQRKAEIITAFAKKEHFAKLLETWSLYASAQEIFAYFLARAEHEFSMFVLPKLGELQPAEINQLINDKIVLPTITECGTSVFTLNHTAVMGMVYWLAEQCFVRWNE